MPSLPAPISRIAPFRTAVIVVLVAIAGSARADDPKAAVGTDSASRRHTVGECLSIGLANRPTIAAARYSLCAAELSLRALLNLRPIAERLSADIPYRRQQALCGITVASAEVQKAEQDTTYDITLLYYTYVFARQQEITATDVIEQLDTYYKVVEELVKSGVRDPKMKVNQFTLYALQNVIGEIRMMRLKADTGRKQALEALKEAMGVDPSYEFMPADTELPVMAGSVTKEQVVSLALAGRPEVVQAYAGAEAFRLEICAQAKLRTKQQASTLGSGSDLSARPVPMAHRNGEYRPGAVPPEMPPFLVGRPEDRVAKATVLSYRQDAVTANVLGLIKLDAANAFLKWESTAIRMTEAKRKFETGKRLVEESRAAAAVRQDPELLVTNEALAGKAQAEYVEAVFEHLKALATLERVTAGGVRPAFPGK